MAWTAKSERFNGSDNKTSAPANLGPGSYPLKGSIREADHAYAPFGSTKPRVAGSKDPLDGQSLSVSPPPGAYDPKLPQAYDPGLPKKHVPFSSSASRSESRNLKDLAPGPGQYEVRGQPPLVMDSRTMGMPQGDKPVLRSTSAPSIPRGHQSYGYEEAGGGRLVGQGPKTTAVFLSGEPRQSAGPGQYEMPDMIARHGACRNGGRFLSGPVRQQDKLHETPGPGHYKSKAIGQSSDPAWRQNAAFASGTDKNMSMTSKDLVENPGPGSYAHVRPAKADLRELRSELQYFGSTTERFKQDGTRGAPGPGSYPAKGFAKKSAPYLKSFCSTQERFMEEKQTKAPGPGAYEPQGNAETVSGPMGTFSILGNSGGLAFGAMSKRFVPGFRQEDFPGPGNYHELDSEQAPAERGGRRGKQRKGMASTMPNSVFKSSTPKDFTTAAFVKDGLGKPPPGAYNPVPVKDQAAVVRLRSKSEGFLSAKPRFGWEQKASNLLKHQVPGPGGYNPMEVTAGKKVGSFNRSILDGMPAGGRPKGLGFESQDPRFRHKPATAVPGPGSYNTEPNWVTKSHNCYFGDLT